MPTCMGLHSPWLEKFEPNDRTSLHHRALSYMHSAGVIHHQLKPRVVMVNKRLGVHVREVFGECCVRGRHSGCNAVQCPMRMKGCE